MQSLNDEREGALWKEEAETSHQEGMRAGRPKGQCHQSPGIICRCPPPILTLQGDWWPLGMARDGSRWVCAAPSSIAPHFTYGPGEAEGEADGIAEGGVGAARAVGDAEGVGAEDGGDGAAVGAGRLGGHAGLVVLEAHAEEGLAVALLEPAGAGAAPPAAVAVAEQPLLIDKLLQLQLEDPGGADLRGGDSGPQTPSSPLPSPAPAPPPRSSRLRQAATAPGSPAGTPRCRDPPGQHSCPQPAGTYLAAAQQHREDGERQQEPTSHFGGAALVPSLSSPFIFSSEGKGESVSRGKGKKHSGQSRSSQRSWKS